MSQLLLCSFWQSWSWFGDEYFSYDGKQWQPGNVRQGAAKENQTGTLCRELDCLIVHETLFAVQDIQIADAQVYPFNTFVCKCAHEQSNLCSVACFYVCVHASLPSIQTPGWDYSLTECTSSRRGGEGTKTLNVSEETDLKFTPNIITSRAELVATSYITCRLISWHVTAYILMPMPRPYCLADHKVLSTLEKPRESASAPTLEAAMPETSHRSSVSSRIQMLCRLLIDAS